MIAYPTSPHENPGFTPQTDPPRWSLGTSFSSKRGRHSCRKPKYAAQPRRLLQAEQWLQQWKWTFSDCGKAVWMLSEACMMARDECCSTFSLVCVLYNVQWLHSGTPSNSVKLWLSMHSWLQVTTSHPLNYMEYPQMTIFTVPLIPPGGESPASDGLLTVTTVYSCTGIKSRCHLQGMGNQSIANGCVHVRAGFPKWKESWPRAC